MPTQPRRLLSGATRASTAVPRVAHRSASAPTRSSVEFLRGAGSLASRAHANMTAVPTVTHIARCQLAPAATQLDRSLPSGASDNASVPLTARRPCCQYDRTSRCQPAPAPARPHRSLPSGACANTVEPLVAKWHQRQCGCIARCPVAPMLTQLNRVLAGGVSANIIETHTAERRRWQHGYQLACMPPRTCCSLPSGASANTTTLLVGHTA